ncbi:MAG: PH domain-containing protein [Lachnospiraceae bacterium]|nr:PH domain-containing protein [Lachnospiraceae bacterium]
MAMKKTHNQIVLHRNRFQAAAYIFLVILSVLGIVVNIQTLLFEPEDIWYTLLYIFILLCYAILALGLMYNLLVDVWKLTLTRDGIICKYLFSTKFVPWADIQDFGLSYWVTSRSFVKWYYLYFSKEMLKQTSPQQKKLRGPCIKLLISEVSSSEIKEQVLPFCELRTNLLPFIAENV